MAIPGFRIFLRPVLELMAEKREVPNARHSLVPLVKDKMKFSDDEAAERLDSGGNRLANRVGWALTYLKKSGLVDFPKRGTARITSEGERFLTSHKGEIFPRDLEVFPGYQEFKQASGKMTFKRQKTKMYSMKLILKKKSVSDSVKSRTN